jgi:YbbR domain-containing protein
VSIIEFLRQRITKNQLVRFGVSFLLATLLWGWVTQLQDPLTNTKFNNIPIVVNGLSDSLILVTTLPTASVTMSGPESKVDPIRGSDISVSLNLNDISGPGNYRVKVSVSKPAGVEARSLEPKEVQIQVEEHINKVFPLDTSPSLPDDDPRQIVSISPSVSQVTVSGPSSLVNRVANVVLPGAVTQQTSNFEALYLPYAVDSTGQRISDVQILPQQVSTVVELKTRGKVVSVIARTTGNPAEGFSVQQRSVVPETVVVDGPDDVLESLLFVNSEPVDISGAKGPISQRVGLEGLPEGVKIVEPASGEVEVRIAVEDTTNTAQTIPSLPVEVVDLNPAYTASVDPSTVSITIDAPQSTLQSLAASDIKIRVSANDLGPGTHQMTLDVSVPDGVTVVTTDVKVVTLTIAKAEATPEASPAQPSG